MYYLDHLSIACALGNSPAEVSERLFSAGDRASSPLESTDQYSPGRAFHLGRVHAELPQIDPSHGIYNCRNNRLLAYCLQNIRAQVDALIARHGSQRIGIALGTSTSGIDASEQATEQRIVSGALPEHFHFVQQQLFGGTDYLAERLGVHGPTASISTACSSSANALTSAARMLDLDLADAVLVGGADTLCRFTVQGFAALDAMSAGLSNPMSRNRDGINIGEAGVLMVLSREPSAVALLAVGGSSDAHHISAPHPQGRGAEAAMRQALHRANVAADAVEYVNLHGTGTPHNDAAESQAVARVLGTTVPCSSSKPLTGHTLGAAGMLETALCYLLMHPQFNRACGAVHHLWDGERDAELAPISLVKEAGRARPRTVLSNSFAFGGNNTSVLLGANR